MKNLVLSARAHQGCIYTEVSKKCLFIFIARRSARSIVDELPNYWPPLLT